MADPQGTLQVIATTLAGLLGPLEERLAAGEVRPLLAELGLQFPGALDADAALGTAADAVADALGRLEPILAALNAASEAGQTGQQLAKAFELANAIRQAVEAFEDFASAVEAAGAGAGIPAGELNQFAADLPGKLIDYLAVRNLEALPGIAETLDFIGVVDRLAVPGVDPQHPPYLRRATHFDALIDFLGDPKEALASRYGWGAPGYTGAALLQKIADLLLGAGVPALLDTTGPTPFLDVMFAEISPKTDDPTGLRIKLVQPFEIDASAPIVQDDWTLTVDADASLTLGTELVLTASDGLTVAQPAGAVVEGDLGVAWTGGNAGAEPRVILGEPGGSRLEARQMTVRAGVGLAWNSVTAKGEGTFKIGGEVKGGKIVVSLANADGFIGSILGGFGLESDFDLGIGFSTDKGLYFTGSAALDIQLPLHVQLGPVEVSALTISVGLNGGVVPISLRADLKAMLGPLNAVVEQIGIGADLSLPPNKKGNAGPLDFALRFVPPKGVGLSLDVGIVKGGGYLSIDTARGEYAGALELAFAEIVTVQAVGIITTKLPDGSKGFSLLIMMSVEFGTGIQLGFGFTLNALGGLVGLNRSMNLQALAEGIRSGAIESVMFPRDVVANAPKIISDLRAFFPPQLDRFLIGPMAKLGWGTPSLVTVSLGVIIEIPGNIAIVGVLRVALPSADAAVINLQVNFIGALEFDKKRIWFYAALYDSRVLFLTLEGEMGLLVAYGDDANFVVSVGGFHPRFSPPPLPFPGPRRISISLLSSPVSRVRVEGYFAVTSNTAQFGAMVEVFYGLDELNVQGHLGFDALFQFSPFSFIIEISASFSAKVFGIGLFSVGVSGSLSGPAPWHLVGHGEISLLFFDIGVDFETTWGEDRRAELPAIEVLPILVAELNKPDNWRALPPPGTTIGGVSLRPLPAEEAALVLHPLGMLRVSQRAMPLDLQLDKLGNRKPSDVNRVSIATAVGAALAVKGDVFEQFAPAQYQNFSDAEKLSRPAFAPERGGLDLSAEGHDTRSSKAVRRTVRYEEIIIDSNYKRAHNRFRMFAGALFNFFLGNAAVAYCPLSQSAKQALQPFADKVEILPDQYAVALQATNQPYSAAAVFHSEASARDFMNMQVANDPSLADTLHVVPAMEMAA